MSHISSDIDFVIAWVDGNDPDWKQEKSKYSPEQETDNDDSRWRDWDNLRYWFRSVEKNAPWVRKIHFVTWGHIPTWLNTSHPKLNIVKHSDYIPNKYLPTFSSHVIELNFHRIKGLSDRFVYFNDDMFICKRTKPSDFFYNGIPRDSATLNAHWYSLDAPIQLIAIRDAGVVNQHFEMRKSISKAPIKWFYPGYGLKLLRTLNLLGYSRFPGFYLYHTPHSYLKSTFQEVWNEEPQVMNETCSHKFREMTDVNQWVMREWQLAKGCFVPRRSWYSRVYPLGHGDNITNAENAAKCIRRKKYPLICINDSDMPLDDYYICKRIVNEAFELTYNEKSSFEM